MAGVEEVVQTVLIPHDGAGAQGGVGIGHEAVIHDHPVILIAAEIVGGVFVDRVVALAVVVGVVQIVELQLAVLGHEGHDVAHIAAFGRGIQGVRNRLIGLVGQGLGDDFFRRFLGKLRKLHRGFRGRARAAAGGKEKRQDQKQSKPVMPFLHDDTPFSVDVRADSTGKRPGTQKV